MAEQLAIHGGPKVKTTPLGTGKRFGEAELRELREALEQDTLFYYYGGKVKQFLQKFNAMYGVQYSVATSSGTAAIHVALGAAGITAGDEVITSPITDQGSVIGILYQNAIPVFADVLTDTYNLDPASIEANITERTKAILAVHLAGNCCDMDAIMAIARKHKLKVIEDCAQSYLAEYKGRLAGTIGDYGCFSTNDFKHISTGDGGIVTINSGLHEDYSIANAFADKNYQRFETKTDRTGIHSLAPNYRMTELQGAVGIAQLDKLAWICGKRREYGTLLTAGLTGISGIHPPQITEGGSSSYWFYLFRLDMNLLKGTVDEFVAALNAEGIPCVRGYIPEPVYMQPMFQNKEAYPGTNYPFSLSDVSYDKGICPHAEEILQTSVRIGISEFYTARDMEEIIAAIRKVTAYYMK